MGVATLHVVERRVLGVDVTPRETDRDPRRQPDRPGHGGVGAGVHLAVAAMAVEERFDRAVVVPGLGRAQRVLPLDAVVGEDAAVAEEVLQRERLAVRVASLRAVSDDFLRNSDGHAG